MTHFRSLLFFFWNLRTTVPGLGLSCCIYVFGETVAVHPAFRESHRVLGGPEYMSKPVMAAGCAVVVVKAEAEVEEEDEEEDSKDWRDPETSRRRFRRLRYGDVSGPEEALSRLRELCRRWLRPERRSKEQMVELLVLEQFLSILPRRLRDTVRHRRPESGEEAAAWARALHPPERQVRSSQQGRPTFKAEARSPTQGEWEQLAVARNGLCRESLEDGESTAGPGLDTRAAWNLDLIPKQEDDWEEEAEPAQAWLQGSPWDTIPSQEEKLPKDAVLPPPQPQVSPGEAGYRATSQAPCGAKEEELWRSGEPGHTVTWKVPCVVKEEELWRSNDFREVATAPALAQHKGTVEPVDNFRDIAVVSILAQHRETAELGDDFRKVATTLVLAQAGPGEDHSHGCVPGTPQSSLDTQGPPGDKRYRCACCGKGFRYRCYLLKHERTHMGETPYPCRVCAKSFRQRRHLLTHERTHTKEQPYSCSPCGEHFHLRCHLLKHEHTHIGQKPYACPLCTKSFGKSSNLVRHLRTHTGERPFMCPTCPKSFSERAILLNHLRTHTGERPYRCPACTKSFKDRANLARHLRTHPGKQQNPVLAQHRGTAEPGDVFAEVATTPVLAQVEGGEGHSLVSLGGCALGTPQSSENSQRPPGDKPYRCASCGKGFRYRCHFLKHERTHTGEKPYACPSCAKTFSRSDQLATHQRTHSGERPYTCQTCTKSFRERSVLLRHERTHTGVKPYTCPACARSFRHRSVLLNHERTHTGERPYSCPACGERFRQRSHLLTHERTHTGERRYTCPVCAKSFRQRRQLLKHERMHTGERPYPCPSCTKSFDKRAKLVEHERTHTGEKPYSCPACAKSFSRRGNLVQHLSMHTGERPYPCPACNKSFRHRSHLLKHERTHTGEKPYSCQTCTKSFSRRDNLATHLRTHSGERPIPVLAQHRGSAEPGDDFGEVATTPSLLRLSLGRTTAGAPVEYVPQGPPQTPAETFSRPRPDLQPGGSGSSWQWPGTALAESSKDCKSMTWPGLETRLPGTPT
ncbi:zinc finger and SCAN domain-containing protein 2-like [Meriones unguiculatus]|uniref:zinc finger and SCAN domain-containing protein 2-like n=1 Tax=Meriones unguiculatus TaxID=10047 RepID=UPI00293E61D2|nr:zinc finger and SCAN domain-containing protein 2-like [Meriones unguiculatus]